MSIVNAKNFQFTYPAAEERALEGVSFEIKRGEVLGIIGPVGAGKTTLCMAIAGFAPRITGGDASGELHVIEDRQEAIDQEQGNRNQDDEKDHPIGMVFEDYAGQLTQLKMFDEVKNPLLNRGFSEEESNHRTRELLDQVGLNDEALYDRRVWELSGGQQQRLAIAATLSLDPQILIFDKAIDRLDPRGQEKVSDVIRNLSGDKTLIVVEQDTHLLMQLADRLLVIADGNVIAEGTPEEIIRNDDLLQHADVMPPISLQVARALNFSDAPLTLEEFDRAINPNGNSHHTASSTVHHQSTNQPIVEIRDFTSDSSDSTQRSADWNERQIQTTEMQNDDLSASSQHFGKSIVQVSQLTFCYPDGTQALSKVNLEIRKGEIHAIVGNSSAGKTTLVLHVAGLFKPNNGNVLICDVDTKEKSATELAMMVGTVFQNPDDQISERTVREEIGFPLRQRQYEHKGLFHKHKRYDDDHIHNRISHACELVGIAEAWLDRDPILLPAGLRRLVTIAEALAIDPQVVSLDEPSVGLSATSRHRLKETLLHLREMGKAILLTENDVDFVAEVADTMTVMDQGRIVLQGSVQEVFAEQNWSTLSELYIHPPHVAQLAQQVGFKAVRFDQLVAQISSQRKEA